MIDDANGFRKKSSRPRGGGGLWNEAPAARFHCYKGNPRLPHSSQAEGDVMDGPTLAFFGIGLAIVAVFVILMLWDD